MIHCAVTGNRTNKEGKPWSSGVWSKQAKVCGHLSNLVNSSH